MKSDLVRGQAKSTCSVRGFQFLKTNYPSYRGDMTDMKALTEIIGK